ncbi:MAG: hypothetical protein GY809_28765, partial [Planctomycetes bacterium]|nr:hypothetical protein [Planctomycetota bacterium]
NHTVGSDKLGAHRPISQEESLVHSIYTAVDDAIQCELDRLRDEDGIVSSCKKGCCHCCRHHILMDRAEAHALVEHVKRALSADQIQGLKQRTHQWHALDQSGPGRTPLAANFGSVDLSNYTRCCPFLVNGVCIAYPARPMVCRLHLVSSAPHQCYAVHEPGLTEDAPTVLSSVTAAAAPFSKALKDRVEQTGADPSRSLMLLPHWLAIEMDWPFAISP